jgi:hypothetical protein
LTIAALTPILGCRRRTGDPHVEIQRINQLPRSFGIAPVALKVLMKDSIEQHRSPALTRGNARYDYQDYSVCPTFIMSVVGGLVPTAAVVVVAHDTTPVVGIVCLALGVKR